MFLETWVCDTELLIYWHDSMAHIKNMMQPIDNIKNREIDPNKLTFP